MDLTRLADIPAIPDRPREGHKGLYGRVLIVGGSETMVGAPVLAGAAALRMGSGLVQVAMPQRVLAAGLSVVPELIGLALGKGSRRALRTAADAADAIAIGPGMGTSGEANDRLMELIALDKPLVIDADALNLLARRKRWPRRFAARAVLTPHPGEMKRLGALFDRDSVPADDDGRIDIATAAARAFGQIILLKGDRTVVTDGQRIYLNTTGDSSLSKAGSGDVLTGMIASLIGQGMPLFESACAAAHLHGRAGEHAGQRLGRRSVLARDVIDALPAVMEQRS